MIGQITFNAKVHEVDGVLVVDLDVRELHTVSITTGPDQKIFRKQSLESAWSVGRAREAIDKARQIYGKGSSAVIKVERLAGLYSLQRTVPLN